MKEGKRGREGEEEEGMEEGKEEGRSPLQNYKGALGGLTWDEPMAYIMQQS